MSRILNNTTHAEKLASAICADIALYNQEALAKAPDGPDMQEALLEGQTLYQARTAPALHALFWKVAEERLFRGLSAEQQRTLRGVLAGATTPLASPDAPPPLATSTKTAPEARPSAGRALVWVGLLVLFVALWVALGR
jgi:hypothetical protein